MVLMMTLAMRLEGGNEAQIFPPLLVVITPPPMQGNDYRQLSYDEYGPPRQPEVLGNMDIFVQDPSFPDPSQMVAHRRQANEGAVRYPIGLGAPPSIQRPTRSVSFDTPMPGFTHGYTARGGSSQAAYGRAPEPSHAQAPDLGTMFASMSLQQSRILEQNQVLMQDNAALQARMASVEANRPHSAPLTDSTADKTVDSRLAAAALKKKNRRARKERTIPEGDARDSDSDNDQTTAVYLGDKNLTPAAAAAKRAAQVFVSQTFRDICGVQSKDAWPDPYAEVRRNETTNEVYLTPNFEKPVNDVHNQALIAKVASRVEDEFQNKDVRPVALATCNATWDRKVLHDMAKNSFANFRPQWKRQHDAVLAAKAEHDKQANRWTQRRVTKTKQQKSRMKDYAKKQGLDPAVLKEILNPDHQSDEASGPESDTGEPQEVWEVRMAASSGYPVTSRVNSDKIKFVEVLSPEWRSNEFSSLLNDIQSYHFERLTAQERNAIRYVRVRGTGRTSSRIPDVSPWDFGINMAWLEENQRKPENAELLADWGTHGNPSGFDMSYIPLSASAPTPTGLANTFQRAGSLEEIARMTGTMGLSNENFVTGSSSG